MSDVDDKRAEFLNECQVSDEQAFLDAAAIAAIGGWIAMRSDSTCNLPKPGPSAVYVYEIANALLAERRKNMVQP